MFRKMTFLLVILLLVTAVAPAAAQGEITFGLVLVGPRNDHGWSEAHYEGGRYVEENVPGARMVLFESLNPDGAPGVTLGDVVADMVAEGASVIFTTSDAFEADTTKLASEYPDVVFINISGDDAYTGEASPNVGNLMGEMEWGKMIAGCAAALATETGKIGYLGPLINNETRRLAASAYLGARYCYENYAGGDPSALEFNVTWIGFWFFIEGFTLDPTLESNLFFDNGADVVISGIDTTQAVIVAGQRAAEGERVFAVTYDYLGACDEAPTVCLGVPYFHWGPAYAEAVREVQAGTWSQSWKWLPPDWSDINNPDTSAVGFVKGEGLSEEDGMTLDAFIAEMAAYASDPANEGTFFLWEGPLNLQDGTPLAAEGEKVAGIAPQGEKPSIWYLSDLLEGMIGKTQ